jgi:hypothetical protein
MPLQDMIRAPNFKIQRTGPEKPEEPLGHLPAADLERSKDVFSLIGACKAALRVRGKDFIAYACLEHARLSACPNACRPK